MDQIQLNKLVAEMAFLFDKGMEVCTALTQVAKKYKLNPNEVRELWNAYEKPKYIH